MIRKAAWVLLGVAATAALASSQNFAQRNVSVRAGIVLLDSQQQPLGVQANYAPYAWFNLDLNRNVKPAGWSFYNPTAATMVTQEIATRWGLINANLGYGAGPAVGEPITKRDAAYWEVFLSKASDAQITSFDILLVPSYGAVQLNTLEQEKLRKFMEGGGVLWVDVRSGANVDQINGFPLGFTASNAVIPGALPTADFVHPIMSRPNTIGFENLFSMQSEAILGIRTLDLGATFPDLLHIQSTTQADSQRLYPVASDQRGPVIAVGQVGDGYMVVTSRGIAQTLNYSPNDLVAAGANRAHRTFNPVITKDKDAAAKLAINLVSLTSGHAQMGKGSRKSNATPIDVTAPLLKRFDTDINLNPQPFDYFPPALFQGLVVMSVGNTLVAYDANPSSDLNRDGNPDDGVTDFSVGANVDVVWQYQIAAEGSISSPACAEIPSAPAGLRQQISVVGSSGRLYIFDAFPSGPVAPSAVIDPPAGTSATTDDPSLKGRGPYAPTYHDGLIFVTDEASAGVLGIVARVWVADATNGTAVSSTARWQAGGTLNPAIQRPSGSAVVGYIPIADNSGGTDRVVYVPSRPLFAGQTAGITSLWLGAKGEKPSDIQVSGTLITVRTRASTQGLRVVDTNASASTLGLRLTIFDANGKPLDATALNARIDGTATVQLADGRIQFTGRVDPPLLANETIRIDYTIDWGTGDNNMTALLQRGQLYLPDDANKTKRILHNIALSPQGTIHLVHSNQGLVDSSPIQDPSRHYGTFYSLREEGRGAFKLLSRYDLYPQHTFGLNQTASTTIRETLFDTDEIQQIPMAAPFIAGNFSQLTFMGGPSILNGVVYVTARGRKGGFGVPCAILMAFQAEPDIPKIFINDVSGSFTIVQPDISRSPSKTLPDQYSTLQPAQFVYEREPGAERGTIRLDNLMSSTRGQMQNAISRSQPIVIRRSGQPDQLIEPDTSGRWSPMLWYAVFHGIDNQSPPTVTGNTVFLAGKSSLPSIIQTGSPFPTTGLLVGLDADISPTDPFLDKNATRPWLRQLWNMKIIALPNDIRTNPDIRWPQNAGVNGFDTWAIRLLQTTLGKKSDALGVVAGDGVLMSWAPNNAAAGALGGIFGFSRADFVVADEGRVGRFDSAGNPISAIDAALQTGTSADVGTAAEVRPLVRATRAYPVGTSDLMVVDTGGDRIVRLDGGYREIRSIERFRLDSNPTGAVNFSPDGYQTNDPLTLKAPRDVVTFVTYETVNPGFGTWSSTGLEYWIHYVIADSGNKRIVELIDRYQAEVATRRVMAPVLDAFGQPALGVLYWHSPSSFSGKNFSYSSLARVYVEDLATPANSRWVYAAGIGSALPTRVDTGLDSPPSAPRESESGNGGIVIFDGANSQVINEVIVPSSGANVFYNPATGQFDAPARAERIKILGNLSSVSMRNVIHRTYGNRVSIMFTDADGIFEIVQRPSDSRWEVDWMLPRDVYRVMRRNGSNLSRSNVDLRAYFARRLDSGEVLVVNGYYGRTLGPPASAFSGEVLQVDGDWFDATTGRGFDFNRTNLGFDTFSIRFELPPISGTRGLVIPVFADRR